MSHIAFVNVTHCRVFALALIVDYVVRANVARIALMLIHASMPL